MISDLLCSSLLGVEKLFRFLFEVAKIDEIQGAGLGIGLMTLEFCNSSDVSSMLSRRVITASAGSILNWSR